MVSPSEPGQIESINEYIEFKVAAERDSVDPRQESLVPDEGFVADPATALRRSQSQYVRPIHQ